MLELLKFVLSDLPQFLGTCILLVICFIGTIGVINAMGGFRRP